VRTLRAAPSLTGMVDAVVRVAVIVAIAVGLAALGEDLRRRMSRRRYQGPALSLYETAYLAGGTARVALFAVVQLIESGQLRLRIGRMNRLELVPDQAPSCCKRSSGVWRRRWSWWRSGSTPVRTSRS
jgi:uncharacterized protein (TIGR04222 family)